MSHTSLYFGCTEESYMPKARPHHQAAVSPRLAFRFFSFDYTASRIYWQYVRMLISFARRYCDRAVDNAALTARRFLAPAFSFFHAVAAAIFGISTS